MTRTTRSDSRSIRELTVGVVGNEGSVARRIEATLRMGRFPLAFAVTPGQLTSKGALPEPDVVVIAGSLGDTSLFDRVRDHFPQSHLLACTPASDHRSLRSALYARFDGVVWESRMEQALGPTIFAVLAGQLVVPRDVRPTEPPSFTNREKQVLGLVIMGLTNSEIANKLYISESTVKSHLHTAYRKLGVRSRGEAARLITDPVEGLGTGILAITH